MASANDFFVLRRFSPIQVQCLLYLQHEITLREKELEAWDSSMSPNVYGSADDDDDDDIEGDGARQRPHMIKELIPMLQQYSMAL